MSRAIAGVDALCFDLFETLIDGRVDRLPLVEWEGRRIPSTAGILHERLRGHCELELAAFLGLMHDVDRELYGSYFEQGRELPTMVRFAAIVERLRETMGGSVLPDTLVQELTTLHMDMIRAHSELPAHHAGTLERLRAKRRIALCSNFSHADTALRILRDLELQPHLDVVVISETIGVRKPRREIFEAVLDGLGLEPERVLHVGDRLRADVSGAAALGMRTAWITRRVPDVRAALEQHEGPAPELVIEDLAELEALLED